MLEWLTDPRTLTLLGGVALAIAFSIWQGRATAAEVATLVKWRTDVDPELARHGEQVRALDHRVGRLENLQDRA